MSKMNVLLIGNGAREHALAWGLNKSPKLERLFISPGNPGTAELGENVNLNLSDTDTLVQFLQNNAIELVVVGPEQPLVDGIADTLTEKGFKVFGPSKLAAQLEGSKSFAKSKMKAYGVPTAAYEVFDVSNLDAAKIYLQDYDAYPIVLKADGLAAGKGVIICENKSEALDALRLMSEDKAFGSAGDTIVFEEFMSGEEASVFAICDGTNYQIIGSAQDHKRIGEGDTGPNTGGMGAYTPAPVLTEERLQLVEDKVIKPMLKGMKEDEMPYVGILYVGLMIDDSQVRVVEFNCRFGDPECQVIIPALESDLLEHMIACCEGTLAEQNVVLNNHHRCTIVLASEGYPGSYPKGREITGTEDVSEDAIVFQSGTASIDGKLVTSGGRVLNVVHGGATLQDALNKAYAEVIKIRFEGAQYRKDIGAKGLKYYN